MDRRKKGKKYGRRNTKRSRAAKRKYKKSGLYKYNQRRKKGRGGRRKKSYRRKGGLSNRALQVYQTMINRGRTPQQAHKVASRIDRMRSGKAKRYFEKEAVQAKSAQALSNVFANIGAAARATGALGQAG